MKYLFASFILLIAIGCLKDNVYSPSLTRYVEVYPANFPDMPLTADNPSTVEGVELGRMLYYDKILSNNQTQACADCHSQSTAFASTGVNSLAHINLGWSSSFLWNGKIEGTLEDIMMFEVEDFFGTDVEQLNQHEDYPVLFKKVFGVDNITSKEIAYALAQFFRTLNSYDSKFDRVMQGLETFTPAEMNGYDIFFTERGDCFHCHGGALNTDNLFHNNGLDMNPAAGRYVITQNSSDVGKFKTPTLRNIEFTAPYMHDSRYETLEEVVYFYSHGLQDSPTIDPLMKFDFSSGVNLNPADQADLVTFLKTFSDTSFLSNPALSDPF